MRPRLTSAKMAGRESRGTRDSWLRLPTMPEKPQAKRFYVSGMVQGVGYRYFAMRVAERLQVAGYVKNMRDGRVEVYAIGSAEQLSTMRAELERGPRAASISSLAEEDAVVVPRYAKGFSVEFNGW